MIKQTNRINVIMTFCNSKSETEKTFPCFVSLLDLVSLKVKILVRGVTNYLFLLARDGMMLRYRYRYRSHPLLQNIAKFKTVSLVFLKLRESNWLGQFIRFVFYDV